MTQNPVWTPPYVLVYTPLKLTPCVPEKLNDFTYVNERVSWLTPLSSYCYSPAYHQSQGHSSCHCLEQVLEEGSPPSTAHPRPRRRCLHPPPLISCGGLAKHHHLNPHRFPLLPQPDNASPHPSGP
jgi:hypothetical protein